MTNDLIRRQDAIDALIEWVTKLFDDRSVVDVINEVPSAQPELDNNSTKVDRRNDDLISREDAIDLVYDLLGTQEDREDAYKLFMKMPVAQQTGHWKQFALYKNNLNQDRASMFCSECEAFFDGYPEIKEWKFCPECGARMDGDAHE